MLCRSLTIKHNQPNDREEKQTMNTHMGSVLLVEKVERSNFASWEYKMHQYLVSQGYLSYVEGGQENQPNSAHIDYPAWEQAASCMLYCVAS